MRKGDQDKIEKRVHPRCLKDDDITEVAPHPSDIIQHNSDQSVALARRGDHLKYYRQTI